MSNFETVKLVRSVVSDRELVPVMTHFHLYDGRIQGTNGKLTLDAPWPDFVVDKPINLPAEPIVRAFEAMDKPELSLHGVKLHIEQKGMKVKIPLSQEIFPKCSKPKEWDPMDDSLLQAIRKIRPFISNDASRLWTCSILYRDGYLYATNNITLVRVPWTPSTISDVETFTLPDFGVDQLFKCDLDIQAMHVRDSAIGFEFTNDVWMESLRYTEIWPDVEKMFDNFDYSVLPEMQGNERAIVDKLLPFVPDKRHPIIRFDLDKIATLDGDMEAAISTTTGKGAFHATPLSLVLTVATHMDMSCYPKAVPFVGTNHNIEGMILGVTL